VVSAPEIRVTYIANEGFLIETDSRRVLVDTLFGNDNIHWCHVPADTTRQQMESAAPPFDAIDLILVTHWHSDHFRAGAVLRHLESNRAGTLVASPQVIERLRADPAWTEAYEEQLREVRLDLFATAELSVAGIQLEAHRLRHCEYLIPDDETGGMRDKHETVENLAYVIEIDGARILHLGDAFLHENRDHFETFSWKPLGLVFFEGWTPESIEILQQQLSPKQVVAMHLPPDSEQIERIREYLAGGIPNAVVFRKPGESRQFVLSP
jgi:L-ascorbate metabolism protein UlaG (beta-lactamase superfamily)